jgi:hypothetical protein
MERSGHQSRIRKDPVTGKGTTFVGLDVHKDAINVAMLLPGERRAVEWQASNEAAAIRRLVRKLRRSAVGDLQLCYEAGPCGYAVRDLCRAREDAHGDLVRGRHRVSKLILRQGWT